jgi:hypothetical protein
LLALASLISTWHDVRASGHREKGMADVKSVRLEEAKY